MDLALDYYQKMLRLVPEGDADRFKIHIKMSVLFGGRYAYTHSTSDLDSWVDSCEQAQAISESRDKEKSHLLNSFASALATRYDILGAEADFSVCINLCNEALALIAPDDPIRRGVTLQLLYQAYSSRYRLNSALSDLEAALRYCHEALDASTDLDDREADCTALGNLYMKKYARTSSEADFEASLQYLSSSINMTEPGSHAHDVIICGLADLHQNKFEKTN